jgi:3-deoxy-D-manno-octulosonic-acid transferase
VSVFDHSLSGCVSDVWQAWDSDWKRRFCRCADDGGRLYSPVMWLLQPLLVRKLRRRARGRAGVWRADGERFGRYYADVHGTRAMPAAASSLSGCMPCRWARRVPQPCWSRTLRDGQLPGMRLLLTHGTATGRVQGRKPAAAR